MWSQLEARLYSQTVHIDHRHSNKLEFELSKVLLQTFLRLLLTFNSMVKRQSNKGLIYISLLTAFSKHSGDGMCSRSRKGWAKKSSKDILAKGSLWSSAKRRSWQSGDTLDPTGSWWGIHKKLLFNMVTLII